MVWPEGMHSRSISCSLSTSRDDNIQSPEVASQLRRCDSLSAYSGSKPTGRPHEGPDDLPEPPSYIVYGFGGAAPRRAGNVETRVRASGQLTRDKAKYPEPDNRTSRPSNRDSAMVQTRSLPHQYTVHLRHLHEILPANFSSTLRLRFRALQRRRKEDIPKIWTAVCGASVFAAFV